MGLTDNWDKGRVYGTFLNEQLDGLAAGTYKVTLLAYTTNVDDDNIVTEGSVIAAGSLNVNTDTLGYGGKARSIDVVIPIVNDPSIDPNPVPLAVEIAITGGPTYYYEVTPTVAEPNINLRLVMPQKIVKATVQTLRAGRFGVQWLRAETEEEAAALVGGGFGGGAAVDLGPIEDRLAAVEADTSSLSGVETRVESLEVLTGQQAQQIGAAAAAATNAQNAATAASSAAAAAGTQAAAAAAAAATVQEFNTRISDMESNVWEIDGDGATTRIDVLQDPTPTSPGRMRLVAIGGTGGGSGDTASAITIITNS